MNLARFLTLSGIVAALASSGCSSPTTNNSGAVAPPPPGTVDVIIQDFSFAPSNITIHAGTTVRWVNAGPSAHTTMSDAGAWASGTLAAPNGSSGYGGGDSPGGTFTFKFTQPGTYGFHCAIHPPSAYPNFVGTITVIP
jgi:plastocyanin